MTKTDQKRIIRDMCNGLKDSLIRHVDEGRIPDTWNGMELRELMADAVIYRYGRVLNKGEKRYRDYKNHVLCTPELP